ncbi:MAG: hypothetical protein ABIP75_15660 [Pyrinomonadaceae bacterium]
MDQFLHFFQKPAVQVIGWALGTFGWVIGLIAGLVQFKSYRSQKKMEFGYVEILERAKEDWKGRFTGEQIKVLTKQFEELRIQIDQLNIQIERDVPEKARRVFTAFQRASLAKAIAADYERYLYLSNETDLKPTSELHPDISRAIEVEFLPSRLHDLKQNRRNRQLLLVILGLIMVPFLPSLLNLFPAKFKLLGAVYTTHFAVFVSVVLFAVGLIAWWKGQHISNWRRSHLWLTRILICINTLLVLFFAVALSFVEDIYVRYSNRADRFVVLCVIGIILVIFVVSLLLLLRDGLLTFTRSLVRGPLNSNNRT